jgi:hypothetical protein
MLITIGYLALNGHLNDAVREPSKNPDKAL